MVTRIVDFELTQWEGDDLALGEDERACLLVRQHGHPLGWVYVEAKEKRIPATRLREAIGERLGWEVVLAMLGRQFEEGTPSTLPRPPFSVVVCLQDQQVDLGPMLEAFLALDYPEFEVLVVDCSGAERNATFPASGRTVRYVSVGRTCLNQARNLGISAAEHDLIAFTTGRSRPDRQWLRRLSTPFASSDVMAVTGLVAPLELKTTPQIRREYVFGMGRGFRPKILRRGSLRDVDLLEAAFGTGANMAVRRVAFKRTGPFDERVASVTAGAECGDLEMLHRIITQGATVRYEPTALVWHKHEWESDELKRVAYQTGRALAHYLWVCTARNSVQRTSLIRFALREVLWKRLIRPLVRPVKIPGGLPRRLVACEILGVLLSPLPAPGHKSRATSKLHSEIKSARDAAPSPVSVPSRAAAGTRLV